MAAVQASRRIAAQGHLIAMGYPAARPRRLRRTAPLRRLVAQTRLAPADLILPMFVREDLPEPRPITSMPGVVQHSRESFVAAARDAVQLGVGGLMLFAVPAHRDESGSGAIDPDGPLNSAVREVVAEVGSDIVVMADLCLDEFTSHGHCGLVDEHGHVNNDATLKQYQLMGVELAKAGVHVVATSGMMDGQVGAVRAALDDAGFAESTAIMAYSAKYASAFYGPFRDAVESTLAGDRNGYQQDPANRVEATREVELDLAEGADMVMVKPGLPYLDVLADIAARSDVPVAAYQVSGEYSMIEAAAANGWIDRDLAVMESLISLRRAGATMVLSYYAAEVAGWLRDRSRSM